MTNQEALREAIEIICDGVDNDWIVGDHEYAREIISQLQRLLDDNNRPWGMAKMPRESVAEFIEAVVTDGGEVLKYEDGIVYYRTSADQQ